MVVRDQWQEMTIPIALSAGLARTRTATIGFYSSLLHMPHISTSEARLRSFGRARSISALEQ